MGVSQERVEQPKQSLKREEQKRGFRGPSSQLQEETYLQDYDVTSMKAEASTPGSVHSYSPREDL